MFSIIFAGICAVSLSYFYPDCPTYTLIIYFASLMWLIGITEQLSEIKDLLKEKESEE